METDHLYLVIGDACVVAVNFSNDQQLAPASTNVSSLFKCLDI